jgi:hypothetical protein
MSTRANIVVRDKYGDKLIFYRHSDGYPEVALELLKTFMEYVKLGKIRDNVGQACGWLIILGHHEYEQSIDILSGKKESQHKFIDWKVGSIEPTTRLHSDIEYLYTIDLDSKIITAEEVVMSMDKPEVEKSRVVEVIE